MKFDMKLILGQLIDWFTNEGCWLGSGKSLRTELSGPQVCFFSPYKFKFLEFKYPPQLDLQKEDNWIIFLLYIFMA